MTSVASPGTGTTDPSATRPDPSAALPGRLLGHDNALNAVRLVLASGVILSHALDCLQPDRPFLPGGLSIGGWCVSGFFAVSGYLVMGSRVNLDLTAFLRRRVARIMPAFWTCLVLTAVVFAPLASALSADDELQPGSAASYVLRNAGLWIFQGGIDHTLTRSPVPGDWNGSLWTLAFEFAAYLGLALMTCWARTPTARLRWSVLVLGLATLANLVFAVRGTSNSILTHACWLAAFFAAGMVLRCVPRPVPVAFSPAAISLAVVAAGGLLGLPTVVAPLPLCYLLLGAGEVLPTRIGSRNDISYGVYVYAFPVTQVLLAARPPTSWSVTTLSLGTIALVVPLAWVSWRLVERPAMRAERRRARRRGGAVAAGSTT